MRALLIAIMATTWSPGESGVAPEYTVPIHVVDSVMGALPREDRKEWRLARVGALGDWGVPYYMTRMAESDLAYVFDANIGTVGIDGMLIPDSILLTLNRMDCSDVGGYAQAPNAGVAVVCLFGDLQTVIAHEYGHALGFYHGGNGVMGGNNRVSDTERALALAYYT